MKDCTHKGVKDMVKWRDEKTCRKNCFKNVLCCILILIICLAMKCTGGKVYMTCGPENGQQMCGAVSATPASEDACIEGCYCPEGNLFIVF